MTWQRIDENTYIDDTLVTCMEYQLFIDEMREQGKYYQPDHWTSYQFLAGYAREPVLGMRHSDALAFCEWLTQREDTLWNYRLPFPKEAENYQINLSTRSCFGYWILQTDDRPNISWISNIANNEINLEKSLNTILSEKNLEGLKLDVARAIARGIKHGTNQIRVIETEEVFKTIPGIIKDLTRDISFAKNTTNAIEVNQILEKAHRGADELIKITNTRDGFRIIENIFALAHNLDLAMIIINTDDRKKTRGLVLTEILNLPSTLDRTLDILINFLVIVERIAGRSPAFEGIRLVKERVK